MVGSVMLSSEASGDGAIFNGVFSNSASTPESVSSFHLTPRLEGDFFFGVNDIPFFPVMVFLRRGEAFIGEATT